MSSFSLNDKVSVVTGAARGIGRAIAIHLAKAGSHIAICDLDQEALDEAVSEIKALGVNATGHICNVAEHSSVEQFINAVVDSHGKIDCVVNNAGITRDSLLEKMTPDQFQMVIDVNLKGVWNVCHCVIPYMTAQQSGSVINIASIIGKVGGFGQSNYAAAKAGVIGMSKALSKETARKNVRVNAVLPGFINTPMVEKIPQKVIDRLVADIPMRRFGEVDEIASLVQFLASDASSYITGATMEATGGYGM
ncbi:hypothetical protein P9112_000988 [Eukaryota sp. TZLM1-RC]